MKFREREQQKAKERKRERKKRGFLLVMILFLSLSLAAVLGITVFRVRSVEVEGNSFYTAQEIEDQVITDRLSANSLYLFLKYKYFNKEDIPFVDKLEISIQSPSKVKIRVYEKSIVGYVTYMGSNFYFDKDGVVVESTSEVKEGVPCISGIQFTTLALYRKLEVADDRIFDRILNVTQLVKKYELSPDRIEFGESLALTLYFGDVRVALGSSGSLEEKIGRLHDLYPDLEGRSGVFHMENYTEDSKFISFEQDEQE